MTAFAKNLTVDCDDPLRVAHFWAAALGSDVDEDSNRQRAMADVEGNEFCVERGPGESVAEPAIPPGRVYDERPQARREP